ncbi:MAG: AAA family ATPase [Flavobacteriaceae bacterium]|nr:AAA family ATPase [Flavobacteriaceae bacterium]
MGTIKSVKNVKNFGIFEAIPTNPTFSDFNRYNLVYGLNGSGKSTLSHLFSLLEHPNGEKRFPESKWTFELTDGTKLSEAITESSLNIRVFDKAFVENNINWNDIIKGILVVSDTKKEEIKKRDQKKVDLKVVVDAIKKLETELNGDDKKKGKKGLIKENSNFLTEAAKSIKEKFQLIDVKDTYLANYNKTKLETALIDGKSQIQKKQLATYEVEKLSDSVKPQEKNELTAIDLTSINQFEEVNIRLKTILNSTVTSIVLEDLKDSPEKSEWAKNGLDLHQANDLCSFCGNKVTKERIEELNNHFSDSFKKLIERIDKAINWIESYEFTSLPNKDSFYKEYQKDYSKLSKDINEQIEPINEVFDTWKSLLEEKKKNPFTVQNEEIPSVDFKDIVDLYNEVNGFIDAHNLKFKNLDSTIKSAKTQLETEYIKAEVKRYNYYQLKKDEEDKTNTLAQKKQDKEALEKDIEELNKIISTEALGAEKFNTDLWKFLGRNDIALEPQTTGGYKIQRNKDPQTKGKLLSEGEKTAIAFVYFINKLKEQDNKIQETIVVVDDPVSSFDSNNLFSSYSYLKLNCNEAKQLFVLTHNFNYFRLVRDWYEAKNKKQKGKHHKDTSKPLSICNIYKLETKLNGGNKRVSKIVDADATLLNYSSEYHYQFDKVIQYSKDSTIDLDKAYLSANAARKTTETFLKFKYPKKVNDFRELFSKAIKTTKLADKEEYIFKFINKYSHAQDFDNDSSDNQLDEGVNVAADILKMIEELDQTHYNEMIEVCNKN